MFLNFIVSITILLSFTYIEKHPKAVQLRDGKHSNQTQVQSNNKKLRTVCSPKRHLKGLKPKAGKLR